MMPGLIFISTGAEEFKLCVADGSQKFVHYDDAMKRFLASLRESNLKIILAHSFFVEHDYLQRARDAWFVTPSLRYHVYLIRDNMTYVMQFRSPTDGIYTRQQIPSQHLFCSKF